MAKAKAAVTEFRNYNLPMHFPVLLLSGDYWKISDIPSKRLHFHNCLEIGVCHSGSGWIELFGEKMPFQAGDVTVIPKNVPHTTYSTPGTESHWSYIFSDPHELFRNVLPSTWKNFDLSDYAFAGYTPIISRKEYSNVYRLVIAAVKELEEQKLSYQLSVKGLLLTLYIETIRILSEKRHGGGTEGAPARSAESEKQETDNALVISPALDYIEENYMQQFSIEHLADLCHWSPTHFRRVFHEIMGTSPLDFVNNTRIAKACNLLRSTEDSVLNISETVGFRSISSFNRYFLKIMRMPPRDYRKQIQKSDRRAESQPILEYSGWLYPE